MQWLKRIVSKWAKDDWNGSAGKVAEDMPRRKEVDEIYSSETIRFNLTPAMGGRILRVTRDGGQKNTISGSGDSAQLYVIPSGEDVGARVSKIINLELMK